MRALEKIQRRIRRCHAVIVGGDEVSYGRSPKQSANWREHMLGQVALDPARTHFLGRIPRKRFIEVLQVSAAHVYLTYPFVLSWSLLEAMACGTPIVASDTAPVREVLRHRENALLVPFHSAGDLAAAVLELLVRAAAIRRDADAGRRWTRSGSIRPPRWPPTTPFWGVTSRGCRGISSRPPVRASLPVSPWQRFEVTNSMGTITEAQRKWLEGLGVEYRRGVPGAGAASGIAPFAGAAPRRRRVRRPEPRRFRRRRGRARSS